MPSPSDARAQTDALDPRITVLDGGGAADYAERVWRCYDQVFGDHNDLDAWRSELFDRHAVRECYRLIVAEHGTTITGFAWGYVGRRGQYWTDLVEAALPRELATRWLDGHFELVELGVLPSARRTGLGRALHDALLVDIQTRCLLSTTADLEDPAVRLYRSAGWRSLGMLSDGVQIMGLDLSPAALPDA